jgi:hypothetical protein
MSPFIMFCAPGTGKSQLVNKYPELFTDCDTIIEELMDESVNTLHTKPELWEYAKNQILPIWKRVHPTKILLTGKTRFIHQSAIVVLHDSAETMAKKCSSVDRNNPISDWDFDAKHQSYLDTIVDYKGLVHVISNHYSFLSGDIFSIVDKALNLYFIDSCEAVCEIMQIAEANRQQQTEMEKSYNNL